MIQRLLRAPAAGRSGAPARQRPGRVAFLVVVFAIAAPVTALPEGVAQSEPEAVWIEQGAGPPPLESASMATDAGPAGGVVLFGGQGLGGTRRVNETWTWAAGTWTRRAPVGAPPPRTEGAMARTGGSGHVILFGGGVDLPLTPSDTPGSHPKPPIDCLLANDTWTWNGLAWTERRPSSSPPPTAGAAIAYHPPSGMVVLFGGRTCEGGTGGTWTWDGGNWTEQHPAQRPPGLDRDGGPPFGVMAYHASTRKLVLFFDGQTWAWDGATWDRLSPAAEPGPRDRASMAQDANTDDLVLFGGSERDDTWAWDGRAWTKRQPPVSPPGRSSAAMAYDPTTRRVVLFGGKDSGPAATHIKADTWTYGARPRFPVVTGLEPATGRASGNTSVSIRGRDLTGALAVRFGDAVVTDTPCPANRTRPCFTVDSDTQVTVSTPAHAPGKVDVSVETTAGRSLDTPADDFTFLPLSVTGLDPRRGLTGGGEKVTVHGTFLADATAVRFGASRVTSRPCPPAGGTGQAPCFTADADDRLTVYTPAHAPGRVDVVVESPGGASADTAADDFTYVDPLAPDPPPLDPPPVAPPAVDPPGLEPPPSVTPPTPPPPGSPPGSPPGASSPGGPSPGGPLGPSPPGGSPPAGAAPGGGPALGGAGAPAPGAVPVALSAPAPGAMPSALPSAPPAPNAAPSVGSQGAPGRSRPGSAPAAGTGAAPGDARQAAPRHAMVAHRRSPTVPAAALAVIAGLLLAGCVVVAAREDDQPQPQGGY